ncbi:immunoglobulin superfamily member 5 isoform X2 [Pungitius pungitius]|uniref:immunoglobulin superfamily member 5 isoform X2 n=1 Tax=Pungitius pungitius TaxID=134920 RepID=UPI002E14F392
MDIDYLLLVLLSCRIQARDQVQLSPETLTVLRGQEARLTCSTSSTEWTVMVWLLNGKSVLTIAKETGPLHTVHPNVTAEKSGDSWVFVINRTERHNHGQVTCDLQGIAAKTANLFVQEKGSVKVFWDKKLAFEGDSVLFKCQAAGWYPSPTVQWQVTDKKVIEAKYNSSTEKSGTLFTVNSNLNVMATRSSDVSCLASVSALPEPLRSSVRLIVVAEVGLEKEAACTLAPLAIMSTLFALLLLLLLCIGAVLWHRRRRQAKAGTQAAVRSDQSVSGGSSVAEATDGKVNLGYSGDGPTDAVHHELIMETLRPEDFVSFHKVPDVVSSSHLSLHRDGLKEQNSTNTRRMTTV